METSGMRSLFMVVNAGFANDVIDIAREEGAKGATIINARGERAAHEVFMGITIDSEKEIILCLVPEGICERIMNAIKDRAGFGTPAHSVCFSVPVNRVMGLHHINGE